MPDMRLYQFPISHYCEKVRFALDYKGINYSTRNLLPGLHRFTTTRIGHGSSVPVLSRDGVAIQGSAAIITYLDEVFPEKPLTPSDPNLRAEALAWERWLDEGVGPAVRRYCYHTLLDHRGLTSGFFAKGGPWWGGLYLRVSYSALVKKMRRFMDINEATAADALTQTRGFLARLNEEYANHEFLVGQEFSRADLAAAALLAPMFQPPQYGLDWPVPMPQPLRDVYNELNPKLDWARRMYHDYRK
jgi:glutathione S-transferase